MKLLKYVVLASASLGAALIGCGSHAHRQEKNEVAVSLADLPAAARATLERESAGGKVTEVEKENKNGRTVYSADLMVGGVAWDITVAEDGTVISKEREKDGEE